MAESDQTTDKTTDTAASRQRELMPIKMLFLGGILAGLFNILIGPTGIGSELQEGGPDFVMRTLLAPNYGVGEDRTDNVTVVLLRDSSLSYLAKARSQTVQALSTQSSGATDDKPTEEADRTVAWPLPLDVHAMILEEIAFKRPKAIFVDILFLDERPNDGAEVLKSMLKSWYQFSLQTESKFHVPIYFAKAPGTKIRADLLDPRCDDPGGRHPPEGLPSECDYLMRRLLPVPKQPERGILRYYPAKEHGELTAAFALVKLPDLCSEDMQAKCHKWTDAELNRLSISAIDMEILWGSTPHPRNQKWMRVPDEQGEPVECPSVEYGLAELLWEAAIHPQIALWQSCPYIATVPVEDLVYKSETKAEDDDKGKEGIAELIEGKVVFYGTSLVGAGDIINPPGQSSLAGVYMHAMALDNLVTFGPDYLRRTSKIWQIAIHVVAVVFLAGAFAVYWRVRRRTGQLAPLCGIPLRLALRVLYPLITFFALVGYGLFLTYVCHIAPYDWVAIAAYWLGFSLASASDLAAFVWKFWKRVLTSLWDRIKLAWTCLPFWWVQALDYIGRLGRRLFPARQPP